MRCVGHLLGDHAAHLGQLGHELILGVQAAGGVDDHHVHPALAAARDRVERHGARVRALRPGDQLGPGALRPLGQLLDGRRAERVGGADEHGLAGLLPQVPGELADRRGLAGPIDASDHDHRRRGEQLDRSFGRPGDVGHQLDEAAREGLAALELAALRLLLELLDDLGRRRGADVGHDQRLLQALPRLFVERLEQRRLDLGGERLAGLREVVAQAPEEPAAPLLVLLAGSRDGGRRAVGDDEELRPVARHRRCATIASDGVRHPPRRPVPGPRADRRDGGRDPGPLRRQPRR